nr:MAG TPA: Major tail protein [Caudoviricetes sp.]
MPLIKPMTDVHFLSNAPVDYQMNNVLWLASEQEEANFFLSKTKFSFDNCRAVNNDRDPWEITVPLTDGSTLDDYYNCNYLMWRNPQFSNKWFYAYIGTPRPASAGSVTVPFQVDYWQTWHWSCEFPATMVRRETVKDDTIGANLIEENVETGEFVISPADIGSTTYTGIGTDIIEESGWDTTPCVLIAYTYKPSETTAETDPGTYIINAVKDASDSFYYKLSNIAPSFAGGRFQQGIYQACNFIAFEVDTTDQDKLNAAIQAVNLYLQKLVDGVMIQSVQILRMIPKFMAPASGVQPINSAYPRVNNIKGKASPTTFGSYTPNNNKLYTQQFNYLVIDNGAGAQMEMGYEYFKGDSMQGVPPRTPTFRLYSQLSNSPACRLIPYSYKGPSDRENPLYSLELNTYPQCSYSYNEMRADYFANQNSYAVKGVRGVSDALFNTIGAVASITESAATLNPTGMVSGIAQIANTALDAADTIAKQKDRARIPNEVVGLSDSNIQFAIGRMSFIEYRMQVQSYYAKIIDNYFTAYGYAINDIKKPELNTRTRFNFIWTQGANVLGDLPTEAKTVINRQMDAGLRIWHDPSAWMDYSVKNTIKG